MTGISSNTRGNIRRRLVRSATLAAAALIFAAFLAPLFAPSESLASGGAGKDSELFQKFMTLPEDARDSAFSVKEKLNKEVRAGKAGVETYVVIAIAELASGDVELFMRNIKKANKLRFYKFQPHPLGKYQPFINNFVNLLRTVREIKNRFEIYPNSSALHYQLAVLAHEYDKKYAIKCLKKAVSLYSDFLDAHLKLAEIYEECMDYNRAIEEWTIVMDLRPYDYRPYYKICQLGSRFGNYTIAKGIYELGQRKKMNLHEHKEFQEVIKDLVADFPRQAGERRLAVEKVSKLGEVVQADPMNADALLEIANTYFTELSDIKQAEQACVRAIHIDQLNYKPHLLYSKILDVLGDTDKAFAELLFSVTEGGAAVKDGYITELTDIFEKKLMSDLIQGRLRVADMVNYFSVHYQ